MNISEFIYEKINKFFSKWTYYRTTTEVKSNLLPNFFIELVICIVMIGIYFHIILLVRRSTRERHRYFSSIFLPERHVKRTANAAVSKSDEWVGGDFEGNFFDHDIRDKAVKRTRRYTGKHAKLTISAELRQKMEKRNRRKEYLKTIKFLYYNINGNFFNDAQLRLQLEVARKDCLSWPERDVVMKYINLKRLGPSITELLVDLLSKQDKIPINLLNEFAVLFFGMAKLQEQILGRNAQTYEGDDIFPFMEDSSSEDDF